MSSLRSSRKIVAPRKQRGAYLVEFVLVYSLFMFVLLGCIEVARLMYAWSALTFVTQRAARVAVVCPLFDQKISEIAVFGSVGGTSEIVSGVGMENISITYQGEDGVDSISYRDIRYVRVSVQGYSHQLLLSGLVETFVSPTLLAPEFATTLPVESLGFNPDSGGSRECFS